MTPNVKLPETVLSLMELDSFLIKQFSPLGSRGKSVFYKMPICTSDCRLPEALTIKKEYQNVQKYDRRIFKYFTLVVHAIEGLDLNPKKLYAYTSCNFKIYYHKYSALCLIFIQYCTEYSTYITLY